MMGGAGLTAAAQTFREQKDSAGEMVLAVPKYVVVPPALDVYAKQICRDTNVNETTTTDKAKPASSKGIYLRKVAVSSTMGVGVRVDMQSLTAA